MFNSTSAARRFARFMIPATMLIATACGETVAPVASESEHRTIRQELFTIADIPEQGDCSVLGASSLDPAEILAVRKSAKNQLLDRLHDACEDGLFPSISDLYYEEVSYYETLDMTWCGDRPELDPWLRVELFGGEAVAEFTCAQVLDFDGQSELSSLSGSSATVERAELLVVAPERIMRDSLPGDLELGIRCAESDAACCSDRNCCLARGGGEGYCEAQFAPDAWATERPLRFKL